MITKGIVIFQNISSKMMIGFSERLVCCDHSRENILIDLTKIIKASTDKSFHKHCHYLDRFRRGEKKTIVWISLFDSNFTDPAVLKFTRLKWLSLSALIIVFCDLLTEEIRTLCLNDAKVSQGTQKVEAREANRNVSEKL